MESIENEIEPGHHIGQPRVSFTESTSIQYRNLLASLNLLEIQIMNRHRFSSNRSCPQSMLLSSSQRKHGQHVTHVMVEACLGTDHQHRRSRSPGQQLAATVGFLRAFESTSYLEGDMKKLRFRAHVRGVNPIQRFSWPIDYDAAKDE